MIVSASWVSVDFAAQRCVCVLSVAYLHFSDVHLMLQWSLTEVQQP